MNPQPSPPGGYPPQPGWQQTPGVSGPPPGPPPGSPGGGPYGQPGAPYGQPGGPPQGPPVYQPTPPPAWNNPPEDHTARNVVIAVVVVGLVIILLAAAYAVTRPPAASLPVIIPTTSPVATKTPNAAPTDEATPEATEQTPTEQPTAGTPTDEPTAEAPTDEPTAGTPTGEPTDPAATPGGSTIPGVEDQQIVLGTPMLVGDPDSQLVTLLAQNVSDLVKSYSLKGTFKNGDTITATASGYVSNHLPGTIRTPTLFVDGEPGASDVLTVAIDSMLIEEPSTPEGDVALEITFGPPTITVDEFLSTVDVEVTNGSDATISGVSVSAGILREGTLVGTAAGYLSDMGPGQTKTATLYVTGDIAETDELLLNLETVLLEQ